MAPLLLATGSLSLGEASNVFDGAVTFEMGLYTIPTANLFDAPAKTLGVGYDYMTLYFYLIGSGLYACSVLTFSPITNLTGWLGKPFLHPFQSLFGLFTVGENLPDVLHFFVE